jgi:hypothetical protein
MQLDHNTRQRRTFRFQQSNTVYIRPGRLRETQQFVYNLQCWQIRSWCIDTLQTFIQGHTHARDRSAVYPRVISLYQLTDAQVCLNWRIEPCRWITVMGTVTLSGASSRTQRTASLTSYGNAQQLANKSTLTTQQSRCNETSSTCKKTASIFIVRILCNWW